jgi:hypothetical protein
MGNISELVWLYVKRRPFLKEILREGIANYSALARKISMEAFGNLDHENAVKMGLVRLSKKMMKKEEDLEGKILNVLSSSSITILSKVAVVISSKELEGVDTLSFVEGKGFFTYILEEKELKKIRKSKSILLEKTNLNLITLHSSPELEEVPGVISHILNALASEGINVVEFVSCYTDTLLVIKQADTTRAYEILSVITE